MWLIFLVYIFFTVGILVDSIFSFVPGVTRGNKDSGSVQDFILLVLLLVLIKIIKKQDESKILLRNPSCGNLLLRPSPGYRKLLER